MHFSRPRDRMDTAVCVSQYFCVQLSPFVYNASANTEPDSLPFHLKTHRGRGHIAVLMGIYSVSNTVALETPWFTTVPVIYASPICVSFGSNDGCLVPGRHLSQYWNNLLDSKERSSEFFK